MESHNHNHDHLHSHRHGHHHHHTSDNIRVAFFLNLGFTVLEVIGGVLTNSVAILSDAIHDLGDSLSLGVAWYLQNRSDSPADDKFSYGYRRFSLLGAFFTSVVLIVGSLYILSEAIPRLMNPEVTSGPGMVVVALIGMAMNGAAVFRLKEDQTQNAKAVTWHLLEDALGWVAVLVVGIIMSFADIPILDPILSILLTTFVLYNVIRNVRGTVDIFLQSTPANVNIPELDQKLLAVEGVLSSHHTHAWTLDGEHHVMSSHVVVPENATKQDVVRVKEAIKNGISRWHFDHITLEIEYGDEDCSMKDCE